MRRVKKFYPLVLLFIIPVFVSAQLQVKNFFSITGKKDVPVNVVVQDLDGLLVIGTNDGVYKFNGKTGISLHPNDKQLIKEVSALYVDSQNGVWIGTKQGRVFVVRKNRLDSLDMPAVESGEKITSFCEVGNVMCIGTYGNGIYLYKGGRILHFGSKNGLSDNVIYKLTCDGYNKVWCGTDAGITEISEIPSVPRFRVISNNNGLPDNIVRDISFFENKLVISMQDSGVCYFDLSKNQIQRDPFFSNWGLGTVMNARHQSSNRIVLATEKNGLLQIDRGAINIYDYQNYIFTNSINQMFVDRERQIWIASKKGLSHFTERRYNFINSASGLPNEKILALAVDNNKGLWLGTTKGILLLMHNESGKLISEEIKGLDEVSFSCAAKAPGGDIWFGTYGTGIVVLDPDKKSYRIIESKKHGLSNDNISGIWFGSEHDVYISTLGGGIIKAAVIEGKPDFEFRILKTYRESEGLGSDYVYASLTDDKDRLFIATDGGGLQVLENDKFTNLTKKYGLESSTIFSLCRDKHNNIWASSNEDGVLKYDGKSIKKFGLKEGLRDEQPQQILAKDNTLFALNSKGVDKINSETGQITYYDLLDGDLEPNLNAIVFSRNKIYSGTNNGVLSFRTSQETFDSIKPLAYIKGFYLDYKPFPIDSIFEFKHNQNSLALEFDGTWLKNPAKLQFRYRLHGLENEWLYSNEGKLVNYNNLDPGNYTFAVQVKNEEDIWSSPSTHSFIILTPIWKRWWFWVLVIAFSVLIIYLIVNYRLRALQRENLLLEKRVKERTFKIEQQSKIIESKNIELEQLSLVASKTDNVVLILDANGRLEYINESFEKQSGMSVAELKQKFGDSIYSLSNNQEIRQIINDAVANKRSVNYESLNTKTHDGTEQWQSSTLTPIFDDEGVLKKIIIIDTDVSLRKRQEQIILQKNKDITDSISYAKKIQHAILPQDSLIKEHLPHSFILYMTKDIVSGDFYWFTHASDYSIIAAVDCTGHGVPGAFMSLIGYNLLNRIINEDRITDPKNILSELNQGVLEALHKNESESKDGMDIAVCKINHSDGTLQFAGAMRPLWIVSKNEGGKNDLKEVRGDKIPIGTKATDRKDVISYNTHTIALKPGDTYYIFTDGYADQFGGPKDKKYSTARFKDLILRVSELPMAERETAIRNEHLEWKSQNEQVDDILVIGFSLL